MKNRGGRLVLWCWVTLPVLGHPTICIIVGQGPRVDKEWTGMDFASSTRAA